MLSLRLLADGDNHLTMSYRPSAMDLQIWVYNVVS